MCVLGGGGVGAALFAGRGGVAVQRRRNRSPPTQSSGESRSPAGRESGERLDGAKFRNAKNLTDAVIATPSPTPVPGRSSPSQADPDTSPFGSGKGGEGNKHRATHDSGRAGLRARAAPYRWATTQGKFWSVCAGREGGAVAFLLAVCAHAGGAEWRGRDGR